MKKIILAVVLSSLLPAIAVAKDKTMHNTNPNANANANEPLMSGKHMMNSDPKPSGMTGKHMNMGDNPYSSHPKSDAGAAKTSDKVNKGYTVIKYKK